jgi:hypothetical protein
MTAPPGMQMAWQWVSGKRAKQNRKHASQRILSVSEIAD